MNKCLVTLVTFEGISIKSVIRFPPERNIKRLLVLAVIWYAVHHARSLSLYKDKEQVSRLTRNHTPSIASSKEGRKDVVNQCLEFDSKRQVGDILIIITLI